ncbi:MAG: hypothetical protein ACKVVT_08715 [Dehalococcoidia bacterium]
MAEQRMTVVFDDEAVARRLRLFSAEHGVSMKEVIQDALRAYLGPDVAQVKKQAKPFDWDAYDKWQGEVSAMNDELEAPREYDFGSLRKTRMFAERDDA